MITNGQVLVTMRDMLEAYIEKAFEQIKDGDKFEELGRATVILNKMKNVIGWSNSVGDVAVGFGRLATSYEEDGVGRELELVGIYSASVLCYAIIEEHGMPEEMAVGALSMFVESGGAEAYRRANEWRKKWEHGGAEEGWVE